MNLIRRIKEFKRQRNTIKYRLYKFRKKHSRVKEDSPVIIVWELGGFGDIMKKNAMISSALNLRGYKTHFIICNGTPEACIQRGHEKNEKIEDWSLKCPKCVSSLRYVANQYAVEYSVTGDYINTEKKNEFRKLSETLSIDEIVNYKYMEIYTGALAWSSLVRYMKGLVIERKDLKKEYEMVLKKYFYAGLVNTYIAEEVIKKFKPVAIYGSHGVYVDYSPMILKAFIKKIPSLVWSSGFKDFLHYFTIPKKPHKLEFRGITEEEWKKRVDKPLTESEIKVLDNYIYNRFNKGIKKDFLNVSLPESSASLRQKLNIDNDKKIVGLFCHINWDSSFDVSTMIFENANEWLNESLKIVFEVKDVNWIIRVHPGEKPSGSLYTIDNYLKDNFKNIPANVRILWSDSEINSLGLYKLIDAGITLFGTMGVELPLLGKPVITAGEAHFSNKGFTIDAKSKEEYFDLLRNIANIKPLTEEQIKLARLCAYSFFIQRQIPLTVINKEEGHWGNIDLKKLNRLIPGNDKIIDKICLSITEGKDVIMDEEMLSEFESEKSLLTEADRINAI